MTNLTTITFGHRALRTRASLMMSGALSGIDILVVEDDEDSAQLFETFLTLHEASVRRAPCARDGLALAKEQIPHVILSDLAMPDHDGYWFLRAVRSEIPRRIPVIAVTAKDERDKALHDGFTAYMMKPIDLDDLVRLVARVVSDKR